jgi:hypothetical protein
MALTVPDVRSGTLTWIDKLNVERYRARHDVRARGGLRGLVELEFLHVLAYKTAWALERGEAEHAERCGDAERAFLAEHVLRWLPDVAERLRVIGRGSPYGAVGTLLAAYLRAEAERTGLPIEVEAPVGPVEPGGPEDIALCEEPA